MNMGSWEGMGVDEGEMVGRKVDGKGERLED